MIILAVFFGSERQAMANVWNDARHVDERCNDDERVDDATMNQ